MGCVVLIVLGVAFEVVGLGLVAWQLWRVQRREFGMPAWWAQASGRLRRLVGRSEARGSASVSLAAELGVAGRLTTRVRRGPGETMESRLAALEANFASLDQETDARFEEQAQRQARLREMVSETQTELERQQQERESEQRERLREAMTMQWWGTGLFFIGAVLAGVANGVC
jgi:hypothetical protein